MTHALKCERKNFLLEFAWPPGEINFLRSRYIAGWPHGESIFGDRLILETASNSPPQPTQIQLQLRPLSTELASTKGRDSLCFPNGIFKVRFILLSVQKPSRFCIYHQSVAGMHNQNKRCTDSWAYAWYTQNACDSQTQTPLATAPWKSHYYPCGQTFFAVSFADILRFQQMDKKFNNTSMKYSKTVPSDDEFSPDEYIRLVKYGDTGFRVS